MPGARTSGGGLRSTLTPKSDSMAWTVMPPGLSNTGTSRVRSKIVDSTPTLHAPPSNNTSTSSPRSAWTCAAHVGLTRPKRFADGAAMPPPKLRKSASATGCAGTRIPIVSRPPVVALGTLGALRSSKVSGPGQYAFAKRCAELGTSDVQRGSSSSDAMWTISG